MDRIRRTSAIGISTGTGVEVKVEEEQSADTETAHTNERVGYLVIEGSL